MTNREREYRTLSFQKPDRGAVEETFYPWVLTANRFKEEGIPPMIAEGARDITNDIVGNARNQSEKYFPVNWGEGVMEYETYLGFDPVRRIHFVLPFRRFSEKILEEHSSHIIKQDIYGRQIYHKKGSDVELEHKAVISSWNDWEKLKVHAAKELDTYFTETAIEKAYAPLKAGHDKGDYSIRLNLEGFFWAPRELLGIEKHLYAFYDDKELLHDINRYVLKVYKDKMIKVIDILQPDVVYFMEDLSGKNGPMISLEFFEEFVGSYYREIIPDLKDRGVGHVFVDTDGDFTSLIPAFLESGVDGFLPMDVNAGMDIVKVRESFPAVKFIGGFNKLEITKGKAAIDREFSRILPVVRSGGYIVGADHQVAPSTSLENYRYYIDCLKKVMEQAGCEL